jgi:hypothetical protein
MLKNIKSAVIYHFIYKMRDKLIIVASLLIGLFVFTFIVDDVFRYMIENDMKHETLYLIIIKWLVVFSIVFISGFMFIKTFREWKKSFFKSLTKDEKELIEKDNFMSAGDTILNRKSKANKE